MNNSIFYFFYNLAHQAQIFDWVVIFLAVYFPYVVVILAGLFLLFHHEVFKAESSLQVFLQKKKEILAAFVSSFLAYFLAVILKILFQFPRPFLALPHVSSLFPETGFSFPSGHAAFFSALAVSLFFDDKKTGYIFIFFALLIGLARIIAGVHFPMDIFGGFILGGAIAFLVKKYESS